MAVGSTGGGRFPGHPFGVINGGMAANDPAPGSQAAASAPPPVEVVFKEDPRPVVASFIPSFPRVAATVDSYAKHMPWYFWFVAGIALTWWLNRRGGIKRVFAQMGGT